ncbi:MAG: RNA polymerase sigma-70 factor [Bacteroidales bacterium]|jgi:RNA polymerase sigma-70 factor (ECF subfamily)|nr:RNA polymerase sigma-70 factor [Bacteroidales bacterium]MCI2122070.1 RNA polymerase sigma-70 factor [Bacteroidales bacterium]MCI2146309.1 RNA polymerase sigma-70 factor [Bacteroidales bacterium]
MKRNEEILVKQLISGDEKAYKYIYDHYYLLLCEVANEYLDDPFLSEAIVGDVIYHVWEIRASLNIRISVLYYLIRAVRNSCLNFLKSKHEMKETSFSSCTVGGKPIPENPEKTAVSYPCDNLFEYELKCAMNAAVNKLPQECRRVFIKSRFENKSYEKIARELGISVNTVKYHMKNALAFMRTEIANFYRTKD